MRLLDAIRASLLDANTDPAVRWRQLADLAELVRRHGEFGNQPPYSFHDPRVERWPTRLGSLDLRLIARLATTLLLDPAEAASIRAAAAFLLGRTHQRAEVATIAALIAGPDELPAELARQCGFAFDQLAGTADLRTIGLDPDRVGDLFERHGVPWDRAGGVVDVTAL